MEPGRRSPKARNSSRSLDLWVSNVARSSDIRVSFCVADLFCTYTYVQNHGTKKGNPLDAPSMSPAPEVLPRCVKGSKVAILMAMSGRRRKRGCRSGGGSSSAVVRTYLGLRG